jgi:hypothetical protein
MPYPYGSGSEQPTRIAISLPTACDTARPVRVRADIKSRLELIKDGLARGETCKQIATGLGCSYQGVYGLISRLKAKGLL